MNPILCCRSTGLIECFLRFSKMCAKSYDNVSRFIWITQLKLNVKVVSWHLSKVSPVIQKCKNISSYLFFFFFFFVISQAYTKKRVNTSLVSFCPKCIQQFHNYKKKKEEKKRFGRIIIQTLFWYDADEDLETCFSIDWLRVVQAKWSPEMLPIFQFHKSQNILYINWTLNASMDWH